MASPVDAATVGHASGMVTFTGMAPSMAEIDMSDEAACSSKHSTMPMEETVVVGDGGGLANVFVYVKEGLEGMTFPTPSAAVVVDQDGCMYKPHVLGVQTGQDFTLRNSDGILHNIKASPTENRPFNLSQPVVMDTKRSFTTSEVMVPVRCDVHGWMESYIGVMDHPYFAVTGADGSVSLEGLPPGDYVIEAWHERYGTLTQNITVVTGETAELSFEFNSEMASANVPLGEPIDLLHPQGHQVVDR
ncbi:MAG: carboxypeptidase regulatory-like domain-containing protein [Chloroflexi bacterium]|nr:carboxypeptidase regulatory-like domain-containing protein [Chloroflexota bacterium]